VALTKTERLQAVLFVLYLGLLGVAFLIARSKSSLTLSSIVIFLLQFRAPPLCAAEWMRAGTYCNVTTGSGVDARCAAPRRFEHRLRAFICRYGAMYPWVIHELEPMRA